MWPLCGVLHHITAKKAHLLTVECLQGIFLNASQMNYTDINSFINYNMYQLLAFVKSIHLCKVLLHFIGL